MSLISSSMEMKGSAPLCLSQLICSCFTPTGNPLPVSQGVLQHQSFIFSSVPGGPSASVVHLPQCPMRSFSFTSSPVSHGVFQPQSFILSNVPGGHSASVVHLLQCPRESFSFISSPVSQGVLQLHTFSSVPWGPSASGI